MRDSPSIPNKVMPHDQAIPMDYAQEFLVIWNRTKTDYPRNACIHELFESRVQQDRTAVAVVFKDQQLTYGQLNERANQLAHWLIRQGIGPNCLVGLCMDRSPEVIISMLGILKAGGAYVPLDPAYPAERLSFMVEDTQLPVILTKSYLVERLPAYKGRLLCVDTQWSEFEGLSKMNPPPHAKAEDLAYVMYTSGSTGRPKGVEVPHRGVVRLVCNTDYIQLSESYRVAHLNNCSFDASTFEVWGALLSGARLVVLDHEKVLSPRMLADSLKSEGINVLLLTTALFNLLAKEFPQVLANIGHLMFGGEAADPRWVRRVLDEKGTGRLLNLYGPTENTTVTTWYEVTSVPDEAITVPIGRPIANTRVYVLDSNMEPVPVGVPGELYIGGDGLARGYLNRPELTAERFVNNPFSEEPGSRLYRTGDMVRWLPEGILEFLGRQDDQVKLRGYRIELGEIESVLRNHELIEEAVVLLREDDPGDKRLVSYIVPHEKESLSFDDLRAYLRQKLPDYMVPSYFIRLESLPLTPNGKVDRRALPIPDRSLLERGEPGGRKKRVTPRTDLEKEIADIWQDVLGVTHLSIHDNFFEIGGNSIKGAMVINRLQQKLGAIVHIVALFNAPTVAKLAYYLTKHYASSFTTKTNAGVAQRSCPVTEKISDVEVAILRERIPSLSPRSEKGTGRNPSAIFILSPPRSGSTLLRVILGGHPRLFAPPELHLLSFNTLNERKMAFAEQKSFWGQGSIRALMQIHECDFEKAKRLMQDAEEKALTTKEFYRSMQESLADRILVDKTPTYSLLPDIMVRAESDFEKPLYIHLVRHPCGTILSFEDAKLDQLMYFLMPYLECNGDIRFSCREFAELVWIISHQNIMSFLKGIPESRQHRITFEGLTSDPAAAVQAICRFLDLDYHPDMLQPYKEKRQRMTDGVHSVSRMLGDMKFHEHKGIDTKPAYNWKKVYSEDSLADITRRIARELGYKETPGLSSEQEAGWI